MILVWERAEPKDQLDNSLGSIPRWALDWIGSATNRLLKPPNHAAISYAFGAVQSGAINRLLWSSTGVTPSLAVCFPNQGLL